MTELGDVTELHVQHNDHFASLVIHMDKQNKLSQPARDIIRINIHSPINLKDVIELNNLIRIYTYGYGSRTTSGGMDPYNFVTCKITNEMKYIVTES